MVFQVLLKKSNLGLSNSSVYFSSRRCLHSLENPCAPQPISQKCPQFCLSDSYTDDLIDDGSLSSFHERLWSTHTRGIDAYAFKISSNVLFHLQFFLNYVFHFGGMFRTTGGYQGNSHPCHAVLWWWCCRMLHPSWSGPHKMDRPRMLSELSVCLFGEWCWI